MQARKRHPSYLDLASMNRLFTAATVLALSAVPVAAQSPASDRPALVVLIAIDQFRGDYLDRWAPQLTGGLARFRNESALFVNGRQDHSVTETAPGHSTMLSGREPVHTDIVSNNLGVPDPTFSLVGSRGPGASPRRFVGTALYDWILARDPNARALSVSRKDRGAILPIGKAKTDIFWWSEGKFTTSTYYADTLPTWLNQFNSRINLELLAGTRWDLLLPASSYAEPDTVFAENNYTDIVFPHVLPSETALRSGIQQYPWMDSLTLAAAEAGVRAKQLGRRNGPMPDLLSISLSTTDAIGHAFGPDSREIHDQVLRVDRWLGAFISSIERDVPRDRIIYVLTGDHGVAPMPEIAIAKTHRGGRVALSDVAASIETTLEKKYHAAFGFDFDNGLVYGDVEALRAHKVNIDSLAKAIVAIGVKRPGIRAGFTAKTLATSTDSAAIRWRRSLPPTLGWVAAFAAADDYVWSDGNGKTSAEHGTPNALSRWVPISFMGWHVETGRHQETVRTVDIAPTLAAMLGITPLEKLDGVALKTR